MLIGIEVTATSTNIQRLSCFLKQVTTFKMTKCAKMNRSSKAIDLLNTVTQDNAIGIPTSTSLLFKQNTRSPLKYLLLKVQEELFAIWK